MRNLDTLGVEGISTRFYLVISNAYKLIISSAFNRLFTVTRVDKVKWRRQ
jgi:hypothetical protein